MNLNILNESFLNKYIINESLGTDNAAKFYELLEENDYGNDFGSNLTLVDNHRVEYYQPDAFFNADFYDNGKVEFTCSDDYVDNPNYHEVYDSYEEFIDEFQKFFVLKYIILEGEESWMKVNLLPGLHSISDEFMVNPFGKIKGKSGNLMKPSSNMGDVFASHYTLKQKNGKNTSVAVSRIENALEELKRNFG